MKITLLIAHAAQAVQDKLYILGGGLSFLIVGQPMALAIKIDVPWDQANVRHKLQIALEDANGNPVAVETQLGPQNFKLEVGFEVGRPPGIAKGSQLSVPLGLNFAPLPLQPNSRYEWVLSVNGDSNNEWRWAFNTLPPQIIPGQLHKE